MTTKSIPTTNSVNDNIIDLDLSVTRKKRFRFDKDDSRIVDLNTSDMTIVSRINNIYPKLQELQKKVSILADGVDVDTEDAELEDILKNTGTIADRLHELDDTMRNLIDEMFDAPVSKAAAPDGSMYDLFNGSFRYEYIINVLLAQYEENINAESNKLMAKLKSHTDKYTKKG